MNINMDLIHDVMFERHGFDVITNVPTSVIHHSPTGFEWGYMGSGPADFALNILNEAVPPGSDGLPEVECHIGHASSTAYNLHQQFKSKFLASADHSGGTIKKEYIAQFLEENANGS